MLASKTNFTFYKSIFFQIEVKHPHPLTCGIKKQGRFSQEHFVAPAR